MQHFCLPISVCPVYECVRLLEFIPALHGYYFQFFGVKHLQGSNPVCLN